MPDRKNAVTGALAVLAAVSGAGAVFQNGRTRDACVSMLVWAATTLAVVLHWGEER